MTKRMHLTFIIAAVCLGLLIHPTSVKAFPVLPSSFYGTVKVNNLYIHDGTLIQALINNQIVAQILSQTYQGDSVYSLDVPGDNTDTPIIDGGKEGDTIQFIIGGLLANQTGTWHSGTNITFNLSVNSSSTPIPPQATSTPTPISLQPSSTSTTILRQPTSTVTKITAQTAVMQSSSTLVPTIKSLIQPSEILTLPTPSPTELTNQDITSTVIIPTSVMKETATHVSTAIKEQVSQTLPIANADLPEGENKNTPLIFFIFPAILISGLLICVWYILMKK